MRVLSLLAVLPLLAAPAFAQSPAAPPAALAAAQASVAARPAAPFAQSPAAPAAQASVAARPAAQHRRLSWQKRFDQANTSHDGHLTLEQARAGYVTVARHFTEIDAAGKGYITTDDIRAWHQRQRDLRRQNAARHDDPLRPRPALHRSMAEPPLTGGATATRSILPPVPVGDPPPRPKGLDPKTPS